MLERTCATSSTSCRVRPLQGGARRPGACGLRRAMGDLHHDQFRGGEIKLGSRSVLVTVVLPAIGDLRYAPREETVRARPVLTGDEPAGDYARGGGGLMPRRPANPRAWAGCFRCRVKPAPFQHLEAANAWIWKHGATARHCADVESVNAAMHDLPKAA